MMGLRKLSLVIGVLAVLAYGCGASADMGASDAASAESAQAAKEMTPTDLGNRIGQLYVEALTEVTEAMTDRPAADDLQPTLEVLKDQYVSQFVELGQQKLALGEADRATVDSRVRLGINMVPKELFSAYAEGQRHYIESGDSELAKLISEFNIITQYADFELLKQQAPKEAERLGID